MTGIMPTQRSLRRSFFQDSQIGQERNKSKTMTPKDLGSLIHEINSQEAKIEEFSPLCNSTSKFSKFHLHLDKYFPGRQKREKAEHGRKNSRNIERIEESLKKIRSLKIGGKRSPRGSEQTFGLSYRRDATSFENSSFCEVNERKQTGQLTKRLMFNSLQASPVVEEGSPAYSSPAESPVGVRVINSHNFYNNDELRKPVTSIVNLKTQKRYQNPSLTTEQFNPSTPNPLINPQPGYVEYSQEKAEILRPQNPQLGERAVISPDMHPFFTSQQSIIRAPTSVQRTQIDTHFSLDSFDFLRSYGSRGITPDTIRSAHLKRIENQEESQSYNREEYYNSADSESNVKETSYQKSSFFSPRRDGPMLVIDGPPSQKIVDSIPSQEYKEIQGSNQLIQYEEAQFYSREWGEQRRSRQVLQSYKTTAIMVANFCKRKIIQNFHFFFHKAASQNNMKKQNQSKACTSLNFLYQRFKKYQTMNIWKKYNLKVKQCKVEKIHLTKHFFLAFSSILKLPISRVKKTILQNIVQYSLTVKELRRAKQQKILLRILELKRLLCLNSEFAKLVKIYNGLTL